MEDSPWARRLLPPLVPLVRVHADRVHDAALRLGRAPAGDVVERTALELRALVERDPAAAADPVGTWFRLLREAP
ncbi:MAG: hypothetical protein M3P93_09210, partial [Actinomycetota bacterium]|nr:hypothetical protein [Actinomycetota bacterium]